MFAITEAAQWAQENFGRCDLGDKRRGARLVRIAGDLARSTGASLLKSCDGNEAAAEGLYRWLRNAEVDPDAIALRADWRQRRSARAVASCCWQWKTVPRWPTGTVSPKRWERRAVTRRQ